MPGPVIVAHDGRSGMPGPGFEAHGAVIEWNHGMIEKGAGVLGRHGPVIVVTYRVTVLTDPRLGPPDPRLEVVGARSALAYWKGMHEGFALG